MITTRGTYGIPYIYSKTDRFYFADGNLTWLKEFDKYLLPKYLYFWVLSYEGQKKIDAIAKGTAQKAVPIASIKSISLRLPSMRIQQKIADILSAYDDLIENNRRQIKLLEEAAQRLYKEWFVDLRFPGWETTEVVDGVPVGWTAHSLGQLCALRKMTLKPEEIPSGLPYIGLEHIPRKDICLSDWGDSGTVNSNKYVYQENDILFGKIRPYFHKVGFALNDGITSTDTIVVQPQAEVWGLVLMIMSSTYFVDYTYQNCKEGSKMPRADWNQMEKYKVLLPDYTVLCLFERYISNMTHRIKALAMQNRNLMESRDRLLPKLMSGELEV